MSIETQYAKLWDAPRLLDNGGHVLNGKHRRFGLKGDGTTETAGAFADLVEAAQSEWHPIYLPPGTYKLPAGESIPIVSDLRIRGAGRERTLITCEDAYAFLADDSAATSLVGIEGLSMRLRTGSTSGGAIRCEGAPGVYHGQWILRELYGEQITADSSPDPIFHLGGWIGGNAMFVQAQKGELGFHIDGGGFAANANTLFECRAVLNSVAGIYQNGGLKLRVIGGVVESNAGIGIDLLQVPGSTIEGVHLEDNMGAHIRLQGACNGSTIRSNDLFYHSTGSTAPHLLFVGPSSPAALYGVNVEMNRNVDGAPGGTVQDDTNCSAFLFMGNHNFENIASTLVGYGHQILGEHAQDQWIQPIRMGGIWEAAYDPYYNVERPTIRVRARSGQTQPLVQCLSSGDVALGGFAVNGQLITPEATFTPSLQIGGATTGITYSTQVGRYKKIGKTVYVTIRLTLSSKGSLTGDLSIAGLPFTAADQSSHVGCGYQANVTGTGGTTFLLVVASATTGTLSKLTDTGYAALTNANIANNTDLLLTGTYEAAS